MNRHRWLTSLTFVISAAAAGSAFAGTFFSEDFSGGTANWRFNTANTPALSAVASGGPDGGAYISHTAAVANAASQLLFRAQTPFNSSALAYAGNWQALGVNEVSVWFRHNVGQALVINARFANEANFPGASYYSAVDPEPANVPSGVWTKLIFDVTSSSDQNVTYEGSTYGGVFSAVGNMQFGINIPDALRGQGPFTFDLDRVEIQRVPEPAAAGLALLAAAGLGLVRRCRIRKQD